MTGDKHVGMAAQAAVGFIETAQNRQTGGWRYHPGEDGDTSVVGWQVMALKSAQMAGLNVGRSPASTGRESFSDSVAKGYHGGQFGYQPGEEPTPAMTAVGLLCRQYLGAKRDDPLMVEGSEYLLAHLPERSFRNLYYWYYATQVMHNINDQPWDVWNRKMRRLLVETQNVEHRAVAPLGVGTPTARRNFDWRDLRGLGKLPGSMFSGPRVPSKECPMSRVAASAARTVRRVDA